MMTPEFSPNDGLALDSAAKSYLAESAKWGKFLAIVAFVFIGLMVLGALAFMAAGSSISQAMPGAPDLPFGAFFGFLYLIFAAIYLYPTLKLYNFSKKAKAALATNNSALLTESMGNLSSIFKFFGIITAVVLGLYAIIFVFALLAGVMTR